MSRSSDEPPGRSRFAGQGGLSGRTGRTRGTWRTWRTGHTGRRGQVSPVAALVAVFAALVGVTLYAGVAADVDPGGRDRTAEIAADALLAAAADGDVVDRDGLRRAATDPAVAPAGAERNATLLLPAGEGWSVGPAPPDAAEGDRERVDGAVAVRRADRTVAIRVAPGRIRTGTLRVRVWERE